MMKTPWGFESHTFSDEFIQRSMTLLEKVGFLSFSEI
jgi:hypothetical protein